MIIIPWPGENARAAPPSLLSSLFTPAPALSSLFTFHSRPRPLFTFHFSLFSFYRPHRSRQIQDAERKQARSAQRAAGTAQRLPFTPAAEK